MVDGGQVDYADLAANRVKPLGNVAKAGNRHIAGKADPHCAILVIGRKFGRTDHRRETGPISIARQAETANSCDRTRQHAKGFEDGMIGA